MALPKTIYLYRITHLDNLEFILNCGTVTCPNHPNCDKDYIGIGDSSLIQSRTSKQITINPQGNFSDYVSFYFGPRSQMLYNIQKGFNGVTKRSPTEIIYLVSNLDKIKASNSDYVFTDGHGYHNFSGFYNEEKYLDQVDWNVVNLVRWNDTEEDPDRKRRKQAEFLVHNEVSINDLVAIVVYDDSVREFIENLLSQYGVELGVFVRPKWYY